MSSESDAEEGVADVPCRENRAGAADEAGRSSSGKITGIALGLLSSFLSGGGFWVGEDCLDGDGGSG